MSKSKISIIIVNYNTEKEVEKCLNSVISQQTTVNSLEVIVVDNASSDDSAQVLKKFPEVKLIQNEKNLGFAKANNIGAKAATGAFLFFLNPDCEIKRDTISKLLGLVEKSPNAIIGPKILNPDGSLQGSCYNLPTIWGAIKEFWFNQEGSYEKFTPKTNKQVRVEAIVGAAMFMSKKTFEKLGGFDERYFLYYEDLDFCRKAKKLDIPVYYFPKASIIHGLGRAGGNIEHLKKSAAVYHGLLKYFVITFVIKISQWLKF